MASSINFSGYQDCNMWNSWQTSSITSNSSFGYTRKTGSKADYRLLLRVTLKAEANKSIDSFSVCLNIYPSAGSQNPNPSKNFGVEGYLYDNESVLKTNLLNPPGGYISHAAESTAPATTRAGRKFTITFSNVHCTSTVDKYYYIWVGGISASDAWLMEFWGGTGCSVTIISTSTLAGTWRKPLSLAWSPTKSGSGYYSGLRAINQKFTISVPSGYYAYGSQNNDIYYRKSTLTYDAQNSMTANSILRYASCNSVNTDKITASLSSIYYQTIYIPRLCFSGFFDKEYCINTMQYSGSNSKITAPSINSLSGWVFLGYRTSTSTPTSDSVNYTTWAASSPNDIALYGLLKKTLTFNPNGGSSNGSTNSKTYTEYKYGTSSGLSTTGNYNYSASRTGYAFSCWTDSDGDEYSSMADAFKRADSGSTLTAVWSEYKITVKYKANGGTLTPNTTNTTRYRVYNDIVQVSKDSGSTWNDLSASYGISTTYPDLHNVTNPDWYNGGVQKTGYYITGTEAFYLDGNSSLKVNQDYSSTSTTNPSIAYRLNGNANLTANKTIYLVINWKPNPYTLTANANEGTIPTTSGWNISNNGATATKTVNYASTYGTLPTPIRTGYNFNNWYTATTDGNQVTSSTTMEAANVTIYAHWTAKQTNITFNKQSGSGGSNTITATYGSSMPSITLPTLSGYTFLGYYDAASGGTQYYNANGTSAKNWNKEDSTYTLYAQWHLNSSNLILNQQGGTGGTTSVTATQGSAMPAITIPTREGYQFLGYFDTNNVQYYNMNGSSARNWDKTGSQTLYAHWEFQGMHIYYNNDWQTIVPYIWFGDVEYEPTTYIYGSSPYHIEEVKNDLYLPSFFFSSAAYGDNPYIEESESNPASHLSDFSLATSTPDEVFVTILQGAKFTSGVYNYDVCQYTSNNTIERLPFQIISYANAWKRVLPYIYYNNNWQPNYNIGYFPFTIIAQSNTIKSIAAGSSTTATVDVIPGSDNITYKWLYATNKDTGEYTDIPTSGRMAIILPFSATNITSNAMKLTTKSTNSVTNTFYFKCQITDGTTTELTSFYYEITFLSKNVA